MTTDATPADDCQFKIKPCCTKHYSFCWACNDPSRKIASRGKVVGAFCWDCWNELSEGIIPPQRPSKPNSMGAKARMRHLQDN